MRMRIVAGCFLLAGSIVGCTGKDGPEPVKEKSSVEAPANSPANMSHGEAPVGQVVDAAPVDPGLPPKSAARLINLRMEVRDTIIQVSRGVSYRAWTFALRVPGPVVRVTQGDSVQFTLINRAPMPHSMDFHAAQIAPNKYYANVMPNDSIQFGFRAEVVGAFMYHCGTAPVAAHIANGMYGALIVEPRTPRPPARELVFVQSEFYMTPAAGEAPRSLAWDRLLELAPDFVTFNGRAAQYAESPISVKVNELLRIYIVNAGPNRLSSFHVVGGIFDKVFQDGSNNALLGVQTVAVPVGGGAIFELRLKQEGEYPFVTHAFADATKGAVGILKAVK